MSRPRLILLAIQMVRPGPTADRTAQTWMAGQE
jgi:hypothetical protein